MPDSIDSVNLPIAESPLVAAVLAGLEARLAGLPRPTAIWLGLSGGRDSLVLLDVLAEVRPRLPAPLMGVHVDHGLAEDSAAWSARCAEEAARRGVGFLALQVTSKPGAGESLEAWAREARYGVLGQHLPRDAVLLTAHHADDLAETFLLNALRGAGPHGLRGIAPTRRLGAGWLVRPMLEVPGSAIAAWAQTRALVPVADPMNADPRLARAFVRHAVMPLLATHWPAASAVLARNARHQSAVATSLDAFADHLLAEGLQAGSALRLPPLMALSPVLAREILRRWLSLQGVAAPDGRTWREIQTSMLMANTDRQPAIRIGKLVLRRYEDLLHLVEDTALAPFERAWQAPEDLSLPHGTLAASPVVGEGLGQQWLTQGLTVRNRRGGERCRLPGRQHRTRLKHVFQTMRIPPWVREGLPLVFLGDTLVAIADLVVCEGFAAAPGDCGVRLSWQPRGLPSAAGAWHHPEMNTLQPARSRTPDHD
jgi:tRNA(Ile)-lysidine synthase